MVRQTETSRRRRGGFSLMELLIVIAIILVILAIALPKVNSARMMGTETAIIREIQTVHTAQTQYFSQFGKYATTMSELGAPASGNPSPTAADLIPNSLASGSKDGYTFMLQGTAGGYTLTASPISYNGTGRRGFYSDQSLVIRENWGPEPATASSRELNEQAKK